MKAIVATSILALAVACLSGCGHQHDDKDAGSSEADKITANRAKLSEDDQQLVAAQEYCAVQTGHRLGAMGPPVKVTVKDQPVFLCCENCKEEAEAHPDATLERVTELKKKARGQ
jgi:hypothetical protein